MKRTGPSPEALAEKIRLALESSRNESPVVKKTAVRRIVHDATIGLNTAQVDELLDSVERHFPDRAYEENLREVQAAKRQSELQAENATLRAQLVSSETELRAFRNALQPFLASALQPLDASPFVEGTDRAAREALVLARRRLDALIAEPERLLLLMRAVGPIVHAFLRIDAAAHDSAGGLAGLFPKTAQPLESALQRLLGGAAGETLLGPVQETLRVWDRVAPSWIDTIQSASHQHMQSQLRRLDPRACEDDVSRRVPGLRDKAILKECQRRFDEWNRKPEAEKRRLFVESLERSLERAAASSGDDANPDSPGAFKKN